VARFNVAGNFKKQTSNRNRMSASESCGILFAGQGTNVSKSVQKLTTGPWAEEAKAYFARASEVEKFFVCLCLH
jgi:hypothetical protein